MGCLQSGENKKGLRSSECWAIYLNVKVGFRPKAEKFIGTASDARMRGSRNHGTDRVPEG